MQRIGSPFQGAYTAPASGPRNTAQEVQQFGFRTDYEELQGTASRFLPLTKLYDNTTPPHPFAPPCSNADFHGLPPSRGASPSPAGTLHSQSASLFSTRSTASSVSTHPSSSLLSVCEGESPAPGSFPQHPNFRPQSPPGLGRASSPCPYNRPPSRVNARPGSPLAVHQPWLNNAGVARSASRRSNRPTPFSTSHPVQHFIEQKDHENMLPGDRGESCVENSRPSLWNDHVTHMHHSADFESSLHPRFNMRDDLNDAPEPQLPTENRNLTSSPTENGSPGATTMTGLSDSQGTSPGSLDTDEPSREGALRVLRTILMDEFDLRLGTSKPPLDMVSAVSECLEKISISRRTCRLQGYIVPVNAISACADSPETSSPSGESGQSNKSAGGRRKRGVSDNGRHDGGGAHNDDDNDDDDDDADDDGGAACSGPNEPLNPKKFKTELYPCPFRKRNPVKFNVREWEYCSKAPFKGITELKKHIRNRHQQHQLAYRCARCEESFPTSNDLNTHLRRDPDKMCQITGGREASSYSWNNEIVSSIVGERFRSRSEHFDWHGIWLALFPDDDPSRIPDPVFEPPVDLHEVVREYKESSPELRSKLPVLEDPNQLSEIFNEFMDGVFDRAKTQAITGAHGSSSGRSFNKRRSQAPTCVTTGHFVPRNNSGTPSSSITTSSSTAARHIRARTSGLNTATTSGASTPSSHFRNSPLAASRSYATSPIARSPPTTGSVSSYLHATHPARNDHSSSILLSSFSPSSLSSSISTPDPPTPMSSSLISPTDASLGLQHTNRNPPQYLAGQYAPYALPGQQSQQAGANHRLTTSSGTHHRPPHGITNTSSHNPFTIGSSMDFHAGLAQQNTLGLWDGPAPGPGALPIWEASGTYSDSLAPVNNNKNGTGFMSQFTGVNLDESFTR